MTQSTPGLTHVTAAGATMVDVGDKPVTRRRAVAEARVRISPELYRAIADENLPKGSLVEVVRLAGIQGAKATSQLIPLCHPLPLDVVGVEVSVEFDAVQITATAQATARTGVEMEALTAATVAALTVIDMGKAVDRGMVIERVRLLEKTGGSRGDYRADPAPSGTGDR